MQQSITGAIQTTPGASSEKMSGENHITFIQTKYGCRELFRSGVTRVMPGYL